MFSFLGYRGEALDEDVKKCVEIQWRYVEMSRCRDANESKMPEATRSYSKLLEATPEFDSKMRCDSHVDGPDEPKQNTNDDLRRDESQTLFE